MPSHSWSQKRGWGDGERVQASDCLYYNAVKSLPAPTPTAYSLLFKIHIFNVHQITTSGGKCNSFLARTRTKIPKHTPFQVKNYFFLWISLASFPDRSPVPGGKG